MKPELKRMAVAYLTAFSWVFLALCLNTAVRLATEVFLPDLGMGLASLVQVSFGAQVILAWMIGWASVLVVMPAMWLFMLATLPASELDQMLALRITVSSMAVPMAFAACRKMGITFDMNCSDGRTWSRLIVAGCLGAVIIQFGRYGLQCCGPLSAAAQLKGMMLSMTGQVVGLAVVLLALMLWFRWERVVAP